MQLQLGLPVDGSALTRSVQSIDWGAVCYDLLGATPDNIYGGQIKMCWLRDTFSEWWNHPAIYVGIPTTLKDIQLLLDQRSEAQVSLVNYATIEMHQTDRVLRLKCMARYISFPDDSNSTDNIYVIVTRRIARGTVGELISLPISIALWDSNTFTVGDANTSTFFILSSSIPLHLYSITVLFH
ncbi:hypothetical protein J1N35_038275 [Gossypium stocksii]|uniref:Uncharacterized protein n=1 Tax=Gossypium stocksii TaxID=47602 RepID=A0A9D3ZLQ2_9ROSI|nr:hypothetical protein J1N35_038275 [Gossypium stocksii]